MGDAVGLTALEPEPRSGAGRLGAQLDLAQPLAGVLEMAGQRRHDVIEGQPIEIDVVAGKAVEEPGALDVMDDAAVGLLAALGNAGAARRQLVEDDVVGCRLPGLGGRRRERQLVDVQQLESEAGAGARGRIAAARYAVAAPPPPPAPPVPADRARYRAGTPASSGTRRRLVRIAGRASSSQTFQSLLST